MKYPFEKFGSSAAQQQVFIEKLPSVTKAMDEFFRTSAIAMQSLHQKNIFGGPQGIRQDLGFENALKVLLIACYNDRLITTATSSLRLAELIRQLTLRWYSFGKSIDAALFVSYNLFAQQSRSMFLLRDLKSQVEFVSNSGALSVHDEVESLLAPITSRKWYRSKQGIGDKLSSVFISEGDFTNVDLPAPGIQIHFKKTQTYDLRAPLFLDKDWVETPLISNGKVTASCPGCGQKCRGQAFSYLEITCPTCRTVWQLAT